MLVLPSVNRRQQIRITLPDGQIIFVLTDKLCSLKIDAPREFIIDRVDMHGVAIPKPERVDGYINPFKKKSIK